MANFLAAAGRNSDATELHNEALDLIGRELSSTSSDSQAYMLQGVTSIISDLTAAGEYRTAQPFARKVVAIAIARKKFGAASMASLQLMACCRKGGQLDEALEVFEEMQAYIAVAGLGPWIGFAAAAERLLVMLAAGESAEEVLEQAREILDGMAELPPARDQAAAKDVSQAREELLNAGVGAALRLARYDEAFDMASSLISSLVARDASAASIARAKANLLTVLTMLDRNEEAIQLVDDCLKALQFPSDADIIGSLMLSLARIRYSEDKPEIAADLARKALRNSYVAGDISNIVTAHDLLGGMLRASAGKRPQQVVSWALARGLPASEILPG